MSGLICDAFYLFALIIVFGYLVFERFVSHYVAPVAGGVVESREDRLIHLALPGGCPFSTRMSVHRAMVVYRRVI